MSKIVVNKENRIAVVCYVMVAMIGLGFGIFDIIVGHSYIPGPIFITFGVLFGLFSIYVMRRKEAFYGFLIGNVIEGYNRDK